MAGGGTRIDLEDLARLVAAPGPGRRIVAVAGAPGSGKSTLAEALVGRLEAGEPGSAALLPMDGYHFDDRVLEARGARARKGAPDTFDVGGLAHMLARLRRNAEEEVAVPVFDRDLEIARAGARLIPRSARVIVAEGNYLLLGQAPWSGLRASFDVAVMIATPETVLRDRLTARWQGYGLSPAAIEAKVEANDLPNGRFVAANSVEADYTIAN